MNGLNLAFGAEYRTENYKIFAGEPGSYIDADGPGFGGDAGSQGFPGFRPADATDRDRHSVAAYVDVETDVTDRLKVQTALRYENFSDFGSSVTGKLAAAYKSATASCCAARPAPASARRRCSRRTSRRPSPTSSAACRSTRCSHRTAARSPTRPAFRS